MKHLLATPLFFITIMFIIALFVFASLFFPGEKNPDAAAADASYSQGEKAVTIAERKEAFNHALELYSQLDEAFSPRFGTGKLDYNIGNTYFQLEEYPLAILHYYRAQFLMPRNEAVLRNLAMAQQKLGLRIPFESSAFDKIFFFHYSFSLPERLQMFFVLGLTLLLLGVVFLWNPIVWLKRLMIIVTVCTAALFLSVQYTHYLSIVEGVMMHTSILYSDAGLQYDKIKGAPIPAGAKVHVLNADQEGTWLKIMSPDGTIGFVKQDVIRII